MDGFDGTTTGRKGIPYDWRSVLAAHEFAALDEPADWVTDEAIARLIDGAVAR